MRWKLERLGRVATIAQAERADLVRAQWALVLARLQLRTRRTGALVRHDGDDRQTHTRRGAGATAGATLATDDAARARALDRAVRRAATYGPVRTTCLSRATALQWLLEHEGIRGSRLRVGVRRVDGHFAAHAWVELGELVLGDQPQHVRSFTPTDLRLVRR